jgi:broad specificity phosphatase PhoE
MVPFMHELFVAMHPHAEHTERDLVGGWFDSRLTPGGRRDAGLVAQELCRRREEMGRGCGLRRPISHGPRRLRGSSPTALSRC